MFGGFGYWTANIIGGFAFLDRSSCLVDLLFGPKQSWLLPLCSIYFLGSLHLLLTGAL